jgi:predicted Zn-dependent peptidase
MKQRALCDAHDDSSQALTLPELRQMLKKGLISQEEFDKLKKIVIAEVNATTNSEKNTKK